MVSLKTEVSLAGEILVREITETPSMIHRPKMRSGNTNSTRHCHNRQIAFLPVSSCSDAGRRFWWMTPVFGTMDVVALSQGELPRKLSMRITICTQ